MKLVTSWTTILFIGTSTFLLANAGFDGDDDSFHDVDYYNTEHDHDGSEKSQSISYGGYDDDGKHPDVDESHFERYEKETSAGDSKPKVNIRKLRTISAEPPITQSYLYVSPEELGLEPILDRQTRSSKLKSGDEGHSYDNTYAKFLSEHFPKRDDEGKPVTDEKSSSYRNSEDVEEYHPVDVNNSPSYPSDEYERIKSLSNQQASELKKNPENCKIVIKDEMECHVCNDAKTGANSESCSYSSTPDHNKYAYHREKSYDSTKDKKPENDKVEGDDEVKESGKTGKKSERLQIEPTTTTASRGTSRVSLDRRPIKRKSPAPIRRSESYRRAPQENRAPREAIGLDPFLYGSAVEYKKDEAKPKSYESYFSHVFPTGSESGRSQQLKSENDNDKQYEILPGYNQKSDVDAVLAEFATKDWSKCKKTIKGDTTCYECKDKDGIKFEECMFISESNPTRNRQVYDGKNGDNVGHGSSNVGTIHHEGTTSRTDAVKPATVSSIPKSKRVVIKKRKTTKKHGNGEELKPEDQKENNKESKGKRTYKRKVSYKISNGQDNDDSPRSITYEHSFVHSN